MKKGLLISSSGMLLSIFGMIAEQQLIKYVFLIAGIILAAIGVIILLKEDKTKNENKL